MLLLNCCNNYAEVQPWVLMWGVIAAIAIIWSLYIVRSILDRKHKNKLELLDKQNGHEKEMKEYAHTVEKEWYDFEKALNDKVEVLKKEKITLEKEKTDLENKFNSEELKRGLLEKQLKLYDDVFNRLQINNIPINLEVKPKEKQ